MVRGSCWGNFPLFNIISLKSLFYLHFHISIHPNKAPSTDGPVVLGKKWSLKVLCNDVNVEGLKLGLLFVILFYVFKVNEDNTPFVIGKVNCSDTASRLEQCEFARPGEDVGCDARDHSAGVLCYRTTGIIALQYSNWEFPLVPCFHTVIATSLNIGCIVVYRTIST